MDLSEIRKLNTPRPTRKRRGRGAGSGLGKTSGRGSKGAGSRAGFSSHPLAEGGALPLYRKLPKVGFSNARFTEKYVVVNVADLDAYFEKGETVDIAELRKKRLVRGDQNVQVKILGDGDLQKSLTVKAAKFSKSAEAKIAAAGGTCEVI